MTNENEVSSAETSAQPPKKVIIKEIPEQFRQTLPETLEVTRNDTTVSLTLDKWEKGERARLGAGYHKLPVTAENLPQATAFFGAEIIAKVVDAWSRTQGQAIHANNSKELVNLGNGQVGFRPTSEDDDEQKEFNKLDTVGYTQTDLKEIQNDWNNISVSADKLQDLKDRIKRLNAELEEITKDVPMLSQEQLMADPAAALKVMTAIGAINAKTTEIRLIGEKMEERSAEFRARKAGN